MIRSIQSQVNVIMVQGASIELKKDVMLMNLTKDIKSHARM